MFSIDKLKKSSNAEVAIFPSSLRARLLDLLNNQVELEPSLFTEIGNEPDDEIIKIRSICERFDYAAWKMTTACDAQIWNREKAKVGRGNIDRAGTGIMAAVERRRRELGCGATTIRRNAKLFLTFQEILTSPENNLSEKGFYLLALHSPDPLHVVKKFIVKKSADHTFRVRDAERLLDELTSADRDKDTFKETREEKRVRLETHFKHSVNRIKALMLACPDKELGKKIYEPMLQDLRDLIDDMFTEDATEALLKAWNNGYRREDQMSAHTGLPRSTVSQIMKRLENEGEFYKVPQRGETEMARGRHTILWHRKDHVVGNAYTSPQLVKKYA